MLKKVTKLTDYRKDKRDTSAYLNSLNKFKNISEQLFDICSCKCIISGAVWHNKMVCSCKSFDCRVPQLELEFLVDQRSVRQMAIAGIDKATTDQRIRYIRKHSLQHTSSDIASTSTLNLNFTEYNEEHHENNDATNDPAFDCDFNSYPQPRSRRPSVLSKEATVILLK